MFARLPLAAGLTRFHLESWYLGDAEAVNLSTAGDWRLRELSLWSNQIGDVGVAALCAAPWFGRLCSLDLSYNQVGPGGVQRLAETPLPDLSRLKLDRNPIGPGALAALASATLPELRELTLYRTQLNDGDLRILARANWLPRLHRLKLGGNDFSRTALSEFLGSAPLHALRELTLDGLNLDATGVLALTRNPALAELRSLEFNGDRIGEVGFAHLSRPDVLPRLNKLRIIDWGQVGHGLAGLLAARSGRLRSLGLTVSADGLRGLPAVVASPGLTPLEQLSFGGWYGELDWQALLDAPNLSPETQLFFHFRGVPSEVGEAFRQRQRHRRLVYAHVLTARPI